jgi:hypothetical protein
MLIASPGVAATVHRIPLPADEGLFGLRSWLLPAPVLLADGSVLRACYKDANYVVERWPLQGQAPAWT